MKRRLRKLWSLLLAWILLLACGPLEALAASSSPTVTEEATLADNIGNATALSGRISDNASQNHYTVWSSVIHSYLAENVDSTISRVEFLDGTGVLAETYSADCTLLDSKTIELELPLFGGFFNGEESYFLVFGQENREESNDIEVLRVVKYSKTWERLDDARVFGANTYIPFEAGSLRMAETSGKLYIHTCHEMYDGGDGLHHQANMTYVLRESSMEIEDSYYDVMNIGQAGYVSHSFNQFIQTDGTHIYRVDHGDAYPRAVSLTRCDVNGRITSVIYTLPLEIQGSVGANATGVSVGGFELSADSCLIVGNSVDQSDASSYSASGQRNIFLTVMDQSLQNTQIHWLTAYDSSSIQPRTPQMVKLNDNQFLILWEEYDTAAYHFLNTKAIIVDGNGKPIADARSLSFPLSDCQPILTDDGLVKWYVSDKTSLTLYALDPHDLLAEPDISPTPEATNTPTPTPETTNTPTPTSMPTATDTPTPTPKATHTPSPMPEATNTPTPTPEATDTPSPTPTSAPMAEPTPTPTLRPETTPSPTPGTQPTTQPTRTPIPANLLVCPHLRLLLNPLQHRRAVQVAVAVAVAAEVVEAKPLPMALQLSLLAMEK